MASPSLSLPSRDLEFAPMGAMLLGMVSITSGASFAKTLFPLVGPVGVTTLRVVMAALILAVIQRVWRARITRANLPAALAYGCAMGGMNLLFYMAIARIPLGIALAFEFVGPLTIAVAFSRRASDIAWVVLAVAGLLLLLPLQHNDIALDPIGIALALAAGACWGAYILAGKRAGAAFGPQAAALGMAIAACLTLPFGIVFAGSSLLQPSILLAGLVVAVLSSAIPQSLAMFALKRLPSKSFSVLTSGEPAVGAVMGMLLLGEHLPLTKWLGIAAIVAASLGTTLSGRSRPARTEDAQQS
ncbi:EamA family transporter [Terrihabitans sp. B22-R8]|uniref:EamA family transporter n=1 Tax=Terrihabitans sp. B22-R8 TaxID=3425128 RepID=UPI00403D2567